MFLNLLGLLYTPIVLTPLYRDEVARALYLYGQQAMVDIKGTRVQQMVM